MLLKLERLLLPVASPPPLTLFAGGAEHRDEGAAAAYRAVAVGHGGLGGDEARKLLLGRRGVAGIAEACRDRARRERARRDDRARRQERSYPRPRGSA